MANQGPELSYNDEFEFPDMLSQFTVPEFLNSPSSPFKSNSKDITNPFSNKYKVIYEDNTNQYHYQPDQINGLIANKPIITQKLEDNTERNVTQDSSFDNFTVSSESQKCINLPDQPQLSHNTLSPNQSSTVGHIQANVNIASQEISLNNALTSCKSLQNNVADSTQSCAVILIPANSTTSNNETPIEYVLTPPDYSQLTHPTTQEYTVDNAVLSQSTALTEKYQNVKDLKNLSVTPKSQSQGKNLTAEDEEKEENHTAKDENGGKIPMYMLEEGDDIDQNVRIRNARKAKTSRDKKQKRMDELSLNLQNAIKERDELQQKIEEERRKHKLDYMKLLKNYEQERELTKKLRLILSQRTPQIQARDNKVITYLVPGGNGIQPQAMQSVIGGVVSQPQTALIMNGGRKYLINTNPKSHGLVTPLNSTMLQGTVLQPLTTQPALLGAISQSQSNQSVTNSNIFQQQEAQTITTGANAGLNEIQTTSQDTTAEHEPITTAPEDIMPDPKDLDDLVNWLTKDFVDA